jgi:outer membrane lipoprotein-sorting protein
MSSTRLWDRAAKLPATVNGRARPELAVLPPAVPDVATLFAFARDAELRFETLRLRIHDRTATAAGEQVTLIDLAVRHPGHARVRTTEPSRGTAANYEIWASDGETVRTYSATHKLGTERPVRRRVVGLEDPDLPGMSTVYRALTSLPTETLPETFVHPAGFCQNVLGTGACWVSGTTDVGGREAVVLECDHPRTIEITADRPDHHLQVSFDRETGLIARLVETIGGATTRDATAVEISPDATLPPGVFEFAFPTGTTLIY